MNEPESPLLPELTRRWAGLEEKLGFWQATMSLTMTMVGTGIVSLPYCFGLCGYVLGPILLVSMCTLAQISYMSLIQCTAKMHVASYGEVLQKLPRAWSHYTNASLWLLLVLATASYVLIAADIIRSIAAGSTGVALPAMRDPVLFASILLLIFPLCLLRSMHGLSVISTYCSCAIIVVVCIVVEKSVQIQAASPLPSELAASGSTELRSIVLALPILGGAMFGHMNISQIYAELQPKVKPQAPLVALVACAAASMLYVLVGAVGYATFGRNVKADVVAQIAKLGGEDDVVVTMQSLLASFIVMKTPLLILPLRSLSVQIVAPGRAPAELATSTHVLLTLSLLSCIFL